eukprot:10716649-Karenia_brevis.AAC.1
MGFMPQLENLLGRGSFDDGSEGTRFEMLLRTGVPLATQLRDTWHGLQVEMGDAAGTLASPACAAGHASTNVQRELTRLRESRRFQNLDVAIRALPGDDARRQAWTNFDAFSTAW